MNREQLMEYLNAACSAENALYACDAVAKELKRCYHGIDLENVEPVWSSPKARKFNPGRDGSRLGLVLDGIAGILLGAGLMAHCISDFRLSAAILFAAIFSGVALGGLLGDACKRAKIEGKNQRIMEAVQREYRKQREIYDRANAVSPALRGMLVPLMWENAARGLEIQARRKALYSAGVLAVEFQHLPAVHQIRQYLSNGACEGLEGPGARSPCTTMMSPPTLRMIPLKVWNGIASGVLPTGALLKINRG